MKGFKIVKPLVIEEQEFTTEVPASAYSKVRIVKSLLAVPDVLKFNGSIPVANTVPCCSAIGVVSETDANLLDIEKGSKVFVQAKQGCGDCVKCREGSPFKCVAPLTAGEDFDGYLCDFVNLPTDITYHLPDSIDDNEAIFIDQISLCLKIIDTLNVNKGDYVTVVGANNLGIILSQLLIYYQAVPILLTNDEEDYEIARNSDIYYVLGSKDDWNKEVSIITSNRMTSKVVYISDCNIPVSKAFNVASQNASLVYTGVSMKSTAISFAQAAKKQLRVQFLNNGYGNTEASINLITNKAINFSHLKVNHIKYAEVPKAFTEMNEYYEKTGKVIDTIVEMV